MKQRPDVAALAAAVRRDGLQRFAQWNSAVFDALVAGPVRLLAERLQEQPNAEKVLAAYLQLLQQAVGSGILAQADGEGTNFLRRCLVQLIPELLPAEPPAEQVPLLVKVWNLGEGLHGETEWLGRYVAAWVGDLKRLADVESFLVRTLEPVLTPAPPAAWSGPFAVTVLDLRPVHEEFLPGEVCLAAPGVVCVKDSKRPGVQIGVLLRRERQSRVLGLTQGLRTHAEDVPLPAVQFDDQRMEIAGHSVPLPLLRRCRHHAVARAGFVAASAVDSQRLWVVETP
jgi:hypothetical protein